jgi:TPR repeat protein
MKYKLIAVGLFLGIGLYAGEFNENLKECEQNKSKACALVAKAYLNGNGVKADPKKAIEFYTKACNLKNGVSCYLLGILYEGTSQKLMQKFGNIVKDKRRASEFYEKSCRYDSDGNLCSNIAINLEKREDFTNAFNYYKKGCDKGSLNSCMLMANAYDDGKGVTKNPKKAFELYKDGCQQGYKPSCGLLGNAYKEGVIVKQDLKKASKYFEIACDINIYEFCAEAGFLYLQGNGVTKDMKKAVSFNQKACDGGVGFSCMTLGVMAYRGDGMKQNKEKAMTLFKQACELGDENGCNKYKALQSML